jgi:hypothetical protein
MEPVCGDLVFLGIFPDQVFAPLQKRVDLDNAAV